MNKSDLAQITSLGILFKHHIYSCQTAIREEWFLNAWENGPQKIEVNYNPDDLTNIYIGIKSQEGLVCRVITFQYFSNKQLEEYFLEFGAHRNEWRRRKRY